MRKPNNSRPGPGKKSFQKDNDRSSKAGKGKERAPRKQDSRFDAMRQATERKGKSSDNPYATDMFAGKRTGSQSTRAGRRPRKEDEGFDENRRQARGDDQKPRRTSGERNERFDKSSRGPKGDSAKPRRTSGGREERFDKSSRGPKGDGAKPRRTGGDREERFDKSSRGSKGDGAKPRRTGGDREERFDRNTRGPKGDGAKPRRTGGDREERFDKSSRGPKSDDRKPFRERRDSSERPNKRDEQDTKRVKFGDFEEGRAFSGQADMERKNKKPFKKGTNTAKKKEDDGLIRLNKYLSNAGIASRRDADTLIQSGVVKVNGVVVDQLGYKINPTDKVTYGDAAVRSERKVYLLLNKPKDYITTVDDPQERKTVMELIAGACRERVYPVGRLDRNTTGLLLFTNDGELTTRLTHPKYNIKKVYHVTLNKGLKPDDFRAITEGMELEDGPIKADDLAFVGEGKKEIGIEIHSGRNRIVRRIFEQLGYDVIKLDRVVFAGLTKKDLPRGKHRFLTAKEIAFLQMIG